MSHHGDRREAAHQLTALLARHDAFSFIRLGDGEVHWMLQVEAGRVDCYRYLDGAGSVEVARAVAGMEPRHYPRFRDALEKATYLDFCDSIPAVRFHLPQLGVQRDPSLYRNASPETSNIIFEWVEHELEPWISTHRCLFAGAESALLRALWSDPAYRSLARGALPAEDAAVFFHQVRENGRNYSENLDLIKDDLRREIERERIDTLFLSLATGAKILCYELAQELGIRAIDFGSMVRGLTYAGSSGYQVCRDMHNPFFFRVPLSIFLPALERAVPGLSVPELTSRAHAQLVLELHQHRKSTFNTSDGIDGSRVELSEENLRHFQAGRRYYETRYRPRALADPQARRLDADFQRWCLKKGIGWRGKAFLAAVRVKQLLRTAWQVCRFDWGNYPFTLGRAVYLLRKKFGHGLLTAYYRDAVRPRILTAPPFLATDDTSCEIHVLTSAGDWLNLLWALRSFYEVSNRRFALCIHDDGSLSETACQQIRRAFPNARLIRRAEADRHVESLLAGHPRCRSFRAAHNLALKVFDFTAFLQSERMFLLDSDILFFAAPAALLALIDDRDTHRNCLNKDWGPGYTIERDDLQPLLDFEFPPFINSGLGLIHRGSIRFDWVEEFLGLSGIMSHPHQIEQTLIALCSARYGFAMLPPEYDVRLDAPAPGAPSRHYTGPIRHLMYREGMRRLVESGFLDRLTRGEVSRPASPN
jgi:hypothetical protein